MSQLTRKAITESFIRLINQMPFDKITVKDIVEDCGVNRNTFYYHYQDIYALLREVFETEAQKVLEGTFDVDSWQQIFLEGTVHALGNKKGLYHIYNSVKRTDLEAYLYRISGKVMRAFVEKQAEGMEVKEEDITFLAQFYECAMVGLTLRWLDDGMKEEPEHFIKRLGVMLEGCTRSMLEKSMESALTDKKE